MPKLLVAFGSDARNVTDCIPLQLAGCHGGLQVAANPLRALRDVEFFLACVFQYKLAPIHPSPSSTARLFVAWVIGHVAHMFKPLAKINKRIIK